MKSKFTLIIVVLALLLVAFITNPTRDKHSENANHLFVENVLSEEGKSKSLTDALLSGISEQMIEANLKIDDYYIFSISYLHSASRNKELKLGVGVLGRVYPLADKADFKEYKKE